MSISTANTSRERVNALMHLSDQVYPILEQKINGEMRARRIVRVGCAAVAIALREGMTPGEAGKVFDDMLTYELRDIDFGKFVERGDYARELGPTNELNVPHDIAELADRYSDVRRAALLADMTHEPDCVHACHLASWAVPYAQIYYPELDSGIVALDSLLHDLPEAYAGDTPTFILSKAAEAEKRRNEEAAMHRIYEEFHKPWPEFVDAIEAYENLERVEDCYTKTADKLDTGFIHHANNALSLRLAHGVTNRRKFYAAARKNEKRMAVYATKFPLLMEDRHEFNLRIAKSFDN